MDENKRYIVVGTDDFFQHIEDTTLTEDRHEGAIYNIYQVVNRLNEQDNKIQRTLKFLDENIQQREEDLERSIKAGMPTGSMYSEIELLTDIRELIRG
jgi:hypothetical protein